jgi:hypothetical protein
MPVQKKTVKRVQKKTVKRVQKKRNSFGSKYWSEDKDSLEARKGQLIIDIVKKQREMAYKQEEFAKYIVKKQEEMDGYITKLNVNIKTIIDTNAINFNLITKNAKFKNNSKPKGFNIISYEGSSWIG